MENYYNVIIEHSRDDPKQMLKKLEELVPNKNIKQSRMKRLEINANDETDSPKIAEHFIHYFVNIASKFEKFEFEFEKLEKLKNLKKLKADQVGDRTRVTDGSF